MYETRQNWVCLCVDGQQKKYGGGVREGGWSWGWGEGGKLMCNVQFEVLLLKYKPQFWIPKAIPNSKSSLKSTRHRNCLGKEAVGKPRKAQIHVDVHVGENKDGSCQAGHWAIKSRSETFKAQISTEWKTCGHFQESCKPPQERYLRSEPILPRSEEGRSGCYLTAAHMSILVNRSEGTLRDASAWR